MRTRCIVPLAAAALLLGGCATTAAPAAREAPLDAYSTGSVITREEIVNSGATDLYSVVQRLRPGWLTGRGVQNFGGQTGMIVVYHNQIRMGDITALREMAPEYVVSLRFLDASTAAGLPGISPREIVAGAIVVSTPNVGDPDA
ncbi:MAG TPA: hypothetical protein VFR37_14760 [Longimicrobium sp.]|nr:hypothetical protein [Longimicrobium sp.]